MASLLDFPAERTADLPWHIDAKDKDPRTEEQRQGALLRQARLICPAVDFVAIPNAGRRTMWEARKRQREGMKAGALDLVVAWNCGVAFLEMKNGTDMPDANQRERLNKLHSWGLHCGVFRQEMSALKWLQGIGAPFLKGVRL